MLGLTERPGPHAACSAFSSLQWFRVDACLRLGVSICGISRIDGGSGIIRLTGADMWGLGRGLEVDWKIGVQDCGKDNPCVPGRPHPR